MNDGGLFLFLSVATTATLSMVAVLTWLDHRRKEREAFYRSDTIKKVAESGPNAAIEYVREIDRLAARRTRAGLRLAGIVLIAAGAGVMIFLNAIMPAAHIYTVGVIPILVGIALLVYAQFLAPTD